MHAMKKLLVWVATPAVLASALALIVGARSGAAPKVITLKTDKDKVSYLIGFSVGSQLRRDTSSPDEIDVETLAQGIRAAMAGEKLAVSEEEAARVMQAFQQSAQAAREKRAREAAEKNKKEGKAFLAKLAPDDYLVLLDERGLEFTSVGLASWVERRLSGPGRKMVFLIGGAFGFSDNGYGRGDQFVFPGSQHDRNPGGLFQYRKSLPNLLL